MSIQEISVYKAPDFYAKENEQEFILLIIKNGLVFVMSKDEMGIKVSFHGKAENNWMAKDIMQGNDQISREELSAEINEIIDGLPDSDDYFPKSFGDPKLN